MQKHNYIPYILLIPFLIVFVFFRIIPLLSTFYTSFFQTIQGEINFIFLKQLRTMINDTLFWGSLSNTVTMFLMYLVIKFPLLIILSIWIQSIKHKRIALIIIYIPTLVGMFAYAIMFRYLFTYNGVINYLIDSLFGISFDWFGNPFFSRLVIVIAVIWGSLGFYILLYMNTLKNIPKYLYDVIKINGGTFFDSLRYLVLPLTYPILKSIIFLSILEFLLLIDVPLILTQGGPQLKTMTISYYIYLQAIEYSNFSYAATIGIFLLCISLVFFTLKKPSEIISYEMD
jgi:lactose/L-arabinose transport system permease protein